MADDTFAPRTADTHTTGEKFSLADLIAMSPEHSGRGPGAKAELQVRLLLEIARLNRLTEQQHEDALRRQEADALAQQTSNTLANRMYWLTWATVALAVIQVAVGVYAAWPSGRRQEGVTVARPSASPAPVASPGASPPPK